MRASCCWSSSAAGERRAATAPTGSSKAAASCRGSTTTAAWRSCAAACCATRGVRAAAADADSEDVEQTLSVLHEPDYLEALAEVSDEPVVMPELTPPGLPPDIPVCAGLVEAAREGVRTAMTAAERLADGARFTYALCRPPGHHAGPAWFAGYCYLNTAAAAVQALREAGVRPVGILDIDLHYPNGTAAIVETMADASLHSLHASPVTNVAAGTVDAEQRARSAWSSSPAAPTRRPTSMRSPPRSRPLAESLGRAGRLARLRHRRRRPARLLGLRAGDLHRDRPPARRLGPAGLRDPGGRLRARLAGRLQLGLRQRPARGPAPELPVRLLHRRMSHKAHRKGQRERQRA